MKNLKFLLILSVLFFLQCDSDDETPETNNVNLSILDLSANEGGEYTTLSVQLKLDAASDEQITAIISTNDGTAESNKDYIPFNNESVIFTPGETEKTYEITIAGDVIFEEDEHFEVTIVSVSDPATITDATARIDLINDDTDEMQQIIVCPTIDWDALESMAVGSELPYDVFNFGQPSNIPNAEFTSVGAVGDAILFAPKVSMDNDTLLYLGFSFEPGSNWSLYCELTSDLVAPGDSVTLEILMEMIDNDINDVEFKYDWNIMIGTATGRLGPFVIDPKIRIPG